MIVYLTRDISPFVMYCVYGESGSSLLIVYPLYDSTLMLSQYVNDAITLNDVFLKKTHFKMITIPR